MIPTKYDTPLTGLDWLEYYGAHNVYHPGVDFNKGYGNQDCGQGVFAAKSGFIEYVWNSTWNSGGFGKFVIMHHDDGTFTRYAHLQDIVHTVKSGKHLNEGDLLGHVGNTGTTYCHLHFEVFNKECASWQSRHWRRWRAYPTRWGKAKVQQYYINPWEWLKEPKTELHLFEMLAKLKGAGLMNKDIGINSEVPVRKMREYLDFFLKD